MKTKVILPQSLRTLTLLFLLMFLAAIMATGITSYIATHATVAALVDQRLATISDALISDGQGGLQGVAARVVNASNQRDTADLGYILRGPGGKLLFGNVRLVQTPPAGFSSLDRSAGIAGLTHGRAFVRELGGGASLTTIGETEPIDNYNDARLAIYLLGYGSIVLIVLGGVAAFSVTIGRRISALNSTAMAIINGDLARRVPEGGSRSEFDRQARTFNSMLDRITALMEEIGNVTGDIAHDLRTPLARLRGQLIALQATAIEPATMRGIRDAIEQCDDILAMFSAILRIGEIEAGNRRAGFTLVALADVVAEVADMLAPVAADEGQTLVAQAEPGIEIAGDQALLVQLIVNLVENAIRHTPRGTAIYLSLRRSGGGAIITVQDNGPGIAADRRALALRRFGRIDKARDRGGHGLGLPLAVAISTLHHGSLSLSDAAPGLLVTVTLPLG